MPQLILPIFEKDVTMMTPELGYAKREGTVWYFHGSMPVFSHAENDLESFRMFTSQLIVHDQCSQRDIQEAFGISKISIKRYVKKYRESGAKGFYVQPKIRRPRVLTDEVMKQIQEQLNSGKTYHDIAKEMDLKSDTVSKAIRSGRLISNKKKTLHQS